MIQAAAITPFTLCWLILASSAVLPVSALAQRTIIYHRPAEPLFGLVGVELDLNMDGQTDIRFYDASYYPASYYATAASGVGSARLLVTPNLGLDGGSHLVALNAGVLIGPPPNDS